MKTVDELLAALDAAHAARKLLASVDAGGVQVEMQPLVTLMATTLGADAKYTAELWASVNGQPLLWRCHTYDDGFQIRVMEIGDIAKVHFGRERIPVNGNAEAAWSPAHQERQAL